jgi:hypothetical protein
MATPLNNEPGDDTTSKRKPPHSNAMVCGAGGRTRTDDRRFTKPLLYQLSYTGAGIIVAREGVGRQSLRKSLLPLARRNGRQAQRRGRAGWG